MSDNNEDTEKKKTKVVPPDPEKVMSWKEFYSAEKSDGGNKLMDRVWYAIACTDPNVAKQKIFWEHWYWKEGHGEDVKLDSVPKKVGCNHTYTVEAETGKEIDYPIWPLKFTTDSMKMYPAIDLKCFVIAPFGISMQPIMFPSQDSKAEFRVDYASAMGKPLYFIFALTPNMSEKDLNEQFQKLHDEHGVSREWFHMIQWDKEYKIGSSGEPDINPK